MPCGHAHLIDALKEVSQFYFLFASFLFYFRRVHREKGNLGWVGRVVVGWTGRPGKEKKGSGSKKVRTKG